MFRSLHGLSGTSVHSDFPGRRTRAETQPRGRFERIAGQVVSMAPEGVAHSRTKARIWQGLDAALRAASLPCEALLDGVAVEVGGDTDYEPDAAVNCGPQPPGDALAVLPKPVIIVEVVSPFTKALTLSRKLADYFRIASVEHYLIVSANHPQIIHHRRWQPDDRLMTRIITAGEVVLEPPDITIALGPPKSFHLEPV